MAGVEYQKPNPWPIKTLLLAIDKITSNPDLTEIVKELIKLDAKELQQLRQLLRRRERSQRTRNFERCGSGDPCKSAIVWQTADML